MKKLLFATTALAGASLLATAATAQDYIAADEQDGQSPVVQQQPAYAVRIAGVLAHDMQWIDQDKATGAQAAPGRPSYSQHNLLRNVNILGSATADNGLSYGFNYSVNQTTLAIHLSNRLGRLDMGNTFTASDALDVGGRSVMVGRGHFAGGGNKNLNSQVGGMMQTFFSRPKGVPGGAAPEGGPTIRYSTPNYGGLTVAVSYTEEADGNMTDGDHIEDIWSLGAQYTSSYGNYTTVVSGGYERANSAQGTPGSGPTDLALWHIGARVTGMGAGFGIGYGEVHVDQDLVTDPDADVRWFDIGASFSSGPWAISGGMAYVVKDDATGIQLAVDQEQTVFSVSAQYALAPGLILASGVSIWDIKNSDTAGTNVDNDATTFTLRTMMIF